MADPGDTVEALQSLKFCGLAEDYVACVWDTDFLDIEPLPPDLEEDIKSHNNFTDKLAKVLSALTPWSRSGRESIPQGFWTALGDNDLSHRSLIALLYYFIHSADKHKSDIYQKEAAIYAANVYFVLISIPGCAAYNVFHPVLFQKALDVLKLWPDAGGKRKRKDALVTSSQGGGRKGRKHPRRQEDDNVIQEDFDSDNDDSIAELTPQDINVIKRRLLHLTRELVRLLKSFSMKEHAQVIDHLFLALMELSKIDGEFMDGNFSTDCDINKISSVSQLAYMAFTILCTQLHGPVKDMLIKTFYTLMPNILMLIGENKGVAAATIPRSLQMIKDQAVAYICHMIELQGKIALTPARTLLQNVCFKAPDRTEYRSKIAEAVVKILDEFPDVEYASFLQWLVKMSRQEKTGHCTFAIETAGVLLEKPVRKPDENISAEDAKFLSHQFLLQEIILSRVSDKSPVVRAKALSSFAHYAASSDPNIQQVMREVFTPALCTPTIMAGPAAKFKNIERMKDTPQVLVNGKELTTPDNQTATPTNQATSPGIQGGTPNILTPTISDGSIGNNSAAKVMLSMLRRRAVDVKTGVRKSAIQALESVIRLDMSNISKEDIQVIRTRCQDTALSVRKQAMTSLTALLLDKPDSALLHSFWLDGVVPMVGDNESSCQEKCLDIMEDVLIRNIVPLNKSTTPHHKMVWDIFNFIAENEQLEERHFLQKACKHWSKQKKLTPKLIQSLVTHANSQHGSGAWVLLASIAKHCPKLDQSFIFNCWDDFKSGKTEVSSSTLVHVVTVIGCNAKNLDEELVRKLIKDFKSLLRKFSSPPDVTTAIVDSLCQLCNSQVKSPEEGRKLIVEWCVDIMSDCDQFCSSILLSENPADFDEDKLITYIYTLGEVVQLAAEKVSKRVQTLVLSVLAGSKVTATLPSQASQPSSQTQYPLSQLHNSKLSDKVQAFALITLGKMCLVDDNLAKQAIAPLAKELEVSSAASIRNNAVIILCDLCVRYPNLVDRYVPNIAVCVKDESSMVRQQTLFMLTHLLKEDFIKWKGSLFFRFASALVDDVDTISQFAEFSLGTLLIKRHPNMFFNHFLESVFHFNQYALHNMFNKFPQTEREKKLFSLKGKDKSDKRMKIYKFLLVHMTDDQRFQMMSKLCQEVLGSVADNLMPYDENSCNLLRDSLAILASKEIKLTSLRSKASDDMDEEVADVAGVAEQKIKTTIISHAVKKNVMENIVPIIITLKHLLEKHRSPLLKDLMLHLAEVMKDYKNEIKDILAADRQLASEIEYDMRRFEEEEKEKQRKEKERAERRSPAITPRVTPQQGTPVFRQPSTIAKLNTNPATPQSVNRQAHMRKLPLHLSAKKVIEEVQKRRCKSLSDMAIRGRGKSLGFRSPGAAAECKAVSAPTSLLHNDFSGKGEGFDDENVCPKEIEVDLDSKTPEKVSKPQPSSLAIRKLPEPSCRAISTPDRTIADITFRGDSSQMVPLSPIPTSLPARLYSTSNPRDKNVPGTPSFLPPLQSDNTGRIIRNTDVIAMFSPEHPMPPPRKWNVTPKADRQKTRSSTSDESGSLDVDKTSGRRSARQSNRSKSQADSTERRLVRPRRGLISPDF
ncbi:condensin-2 complex subunit D3-L-like [Saccoglossus kowalevskii]